MNQTHVKHIKKVTLQPLMVQKFITQEIENLLNGILGIQNMMIGKNVMMRLKQLVKLLLIQITKL